METSNGGSQTPDETAAALQDVDESTRHLAGVLVLPALFHASIAVAGWCPW